MRLMLRPLHQRHQLCISRGCVTAAQQQQQQQQQQRQGLRARQHVNPLAWKYQQPAQLQEDWIQQSFKQPALPFVVDIGSAKGTASSTLAELNPQQNVLGLEIRRPMVTLAMQRKQAKGLENLHYLASNVNIDLDRILTDIHKESHVDLVTIHFPDPHFKKKNAKRRIVTPQLVQTMARHLRPGTLVSMRSDVIEVLEEMHEFFKTSGAFNFAGEDDKDFAKNSPVPAVKTEREIVTEAKGAPVYRTLFKRSS